jgi:hypothetical protein
MGTKKTGLTRCKLSFCTVEHVVGVVMVVSFRDTMHPGKLVVAEVPLEAGPPTLSVIVAGKYVLYKAVLVHNYYAIARLIPMNKGLAKNVLQEEG